MSEKKPSRWSEETHVKLVGGGCMLAVFATIIGIGYLFPPTPEEKAATWAKVDKKVADKKPPEKKK